MAKNTTKPRHCILSVTGVTKRDKRDFEKLGLRAVKRDSPLFREAVASRHPRDLQKTPEGLAEDLAVLKAEVLRYVHGYTSRGYHAEGMALARLRKAAER